MTMKKLLTISREYGSGGRLIGKLIADKLQVPLYDKEIIDYAVERSGISREVIETAELRAKSSFTYTLQSAFSYAGGMSGDPVSMNEKVFLTQFDIIEQIGELGEGVIVGRCADYVLKEIPNVTNIFVYAELPDRIKRCVEVYGDDPNEIRKKIATYDKARANYYNYHTCQKWGDYTNYNLMLNSSYISEEAAADLVVDYVTNRTYR